MTALEMHIGLDLRCQKFGSNVYGNLLPEEKDIILTIAQTRFIRSVMNPKSNSKGEGFEETISRYDDIEELLTPLSLESYVYTKNIGLNTSVFSILPQNYMRLVRIESFTKDLCGKDYLTNVTVETVTKNYFIIPFTDNESLFTIFGISITDADDGDVIVFDIQDDPTFVPIVDNSEKFIIIKYVLDVVTTFFKANYTTDGVTKYQIYFEKYGDIFVANSFIIVGNEDLEGVEYVIDEDDVAADLNTIAYTRVNIASSSDLVPHRLVKSDDVRKMLRTSFHTTIPTSPLTEIEGGILVSHHNKKFIIANLLIQYIRIPRVISVSLNSNCELNPNVHDKIVDLGASMVASYLNTGTQKQVMMQQLLNE